jgi:uncharacterized metal-binding protein YceD (DUF177 family)
MKIHLQQIPESGVHLGGQETADILDLNDPVIQPLQNVSYSLFVQVEKNNLLVTGQLSLELEVECVSCLRRFHYPLIVPDFLYETATEGRETIDLTPAIREDILLVLPSHPRCDWDGHSECAATHQVPSMWQPRPRTHRLSFLRLLSRPPGSKR